MSIVFRWGTLLTYSVSIQMLVYQLFFGQLLNNCLPIAQSLLHRVNVNEMEVKWKIVSKKVTQKYYYDNDAK